MLARASPLSFFLSSRRLDPFLCYYNFFAMSNTFLTFADAFLAGPKKLPSSAHVNTKSFYGQLRKDMQSFTDDVDKFIPHLERVIARLVHLQGTTHSSQAWDTHWNLVLDHAFIRAFVAASRWLGPDAMPAGYMITGPPPQA